MSPPPATVEVLLPVFGAADALDVCLRSVLRHTDLERHRLVILVDGPQPPEVDAVLDRIEPGGRRIEILRSPHRLGYVGNVNRGLDTSRGDAPGDVVLLNSDTRVTAGWLDKMTRAAVSRPRIASVTPFSNNATLCSVPRFLAENEIPSGHDVDSFAGLVEAVSERTYPTLPTGIGFCLLLRREALEAVGSFDPSRFGLGYGEEVEWCLRARRRGWHHVLDDATFIYHAGQGSFGTSRAGRVRSAHRVLRRLHPTYLDEVARFIEADPLAPARDRILEQLRPRRSRRRPPARVTHLVHGWPPHAVGGTELYARWLVERQAAWRRPSVYTRIARSGRLLGEAVERLDDGVRVRMVVNNFAQRNPLSRNGLVDRGLSADFRKFLAEEEPQLLHVHHLAGHVATLPRVAAGLGVPVVFQLQDWWAPCARVNLFHRDGVLCDGPRPARCSACRPLTRLPGHRVWNPVLHRLRRSLMRRALAAADVLVAGSHHIVETYRSWGYLPSGTPVRVLPYGVDLGHLRDHDRRRGPAPSPPVRVGYVGALLPHKGLDTLIDAFAELEPGEATLELWGSRQGAPAFVAALEERSDPGKVSFRGTFDEADKGRILSRLDLLVLPSVGLESYGLVAREAMAVGVPVLASRRGALAEMMEGTDTDTGAGAALPAGDVAAWRQALRELAAHPERIAGWQRGLPEVKSMDRHAEEIEDVYREVLAGGVGR